MIYKKSITPFSIILILLNPFFATIYSVFKVLFSARPRIFIYIIIFFLALINITIDWRDTDYSWYLPLFKDALRSDFTDYMFSLHNAKEPLYTLINWCVAHVVGGNVILFSIFSTFFFYSCGVEGIIRLGKVLNARRVYIVTSVIFFLFFPYIFANSANLLRQYYATGMMLLAIPEILGGNKKYWILAIAAVFVHTSSGLLLLLLIMPFLKWAFSYKSALFYLGVFFVLKYLAVIAEKLLSVPALSFMTYALTKASTETTFETEYTMGKLLFAMLIVGIPFFIVNINSKLRNNTIIVQIINLQLFFFIYIASNLNQAELCVRLNIYLWCLLPFNILICISYYKLRTNIMFIGNIFLFCFFVFYMLFMTKYTYYCMNNLFINTIINFFYQSRL